MGEGSYPLATMNGIPHRHEFFAWKLFDALVYNARLSFIPLPINTAALSLGLLVNLGLIYV
jgi:hypothetical protein